MTRHSLPQDNSPAFSFTPLDYHTLRRAQFMLGQVLNSGMSPMMSKAYLQWVSKDMKRVLDSSAR